MILRNYRKWSRREEADFYRTISSFGVEYDRRTDSFEWTKFRTFSRLDKKLDDTLTEYFKAFYAMCKRVTGRKLTDEEENLPISVDPISEERASRCLARIDLLSKVREEILPHPELDERLTLCQPSIDLPDWWQCGKHDKDLLIGAAKYGLNRLDFNVMQDPELSFKEVMRQAEEATKKMEAELITKPEPQEESKSAPSDDQPADSKPIDATKDVTAEAEQETGEAKPADDVSAVKSETEQKSAAVNGEHVADDNAEEAEKAEKPSSPLVNGVDKNEHQEEEVDAKTNGVHDDEKAEKASDKDEQGENVSEENGAHKVNGAVDVAAEPEKEVIAEKDKVKDDEQEKPADETKPVENGVESEATADESEAKDAEHVEEDAEKAVKTEKPDESAQPETDTVETEPALEPAKAADGEKLESDEPAANGAVAEDAKENKQSREQDQPEALVVDKAEPTDAPAAAQAAPVLKPFRWPKDRVLQMRLEQICYCVEKNEWPSLRHTFFGLPGTVASTPSVATADSSPRAPSPGSLSSVSREPTPHPTPEHTPRRESLSPLPDYSFYDNAIVSFCLMMT